MDFFVLTIVGLIGILVGFAVGLTNGGGGLISIPLLILLGLPPQIAVATDRFGSLGYAASSTYKFLKSRKIVFSYILPLAIISSIGGLIGAKILIDIDKALLVKIIGIAIALLLPLVFLKKDAGIEKKKTGSKKMLFAGFLLYFLIAVYDGFLGAGAGFLIAYLFIFVFGLTYIEANATEKIPFLFNAIVSISVFVGHHIINYPFGIAMMAGTLIGGYIGANTAVKRGDKFVRIAFIIIVVVSEIKFIFFS